MTDTEILELLKKYCKYKIDRFEKIEESIVIMKKTFLFSDDGLCLDKVVDENRSGKMAYLDILNRIENTEALKLLLDLTGENK